MENKDEKTISAEDAKQVIEKEKQERMRAAADGIKVVLDKYNCIIDVSIMLRANQVIPTIAIVAN